jgi:tRNA (guanine37-N1)-methyltransferase
VLGQGSSFAEDSFGGDGLLECPAFTRPQEVAGLKVPDFLLSGHHEKIETYRKAISLVRTEHRRPDLIEKHKITPKELIRARGIVAELSQEERALLGVESEELKT